VSASFAAAFVACCVLQCALGFVVIGARESIWVQVAYRTEIPLFARFVTSGW
jgi:hypothetical protein